MIPNHRLNAYLLDALDGARRATGIGTVLTTANRNWELEIRGDGAHVRAVAGVAVDMESATIAANGFRYRIPSATLLCDLRQAAARPPKLTEAARRSTTPRRGHLEITLECIDRVRREHPAGVPTADIRSTDEPLFGRD